MSKMVYDTKVNAFYWVGEFNQKAQPKTVGFDWNKDRKRWETNNPNIAAKLISIATPMTAIKLRSLVKNAAESYANSFMDSSNIEIPHPEGYDFFPFQKAAIQVAASRHANSLCSHVGNLEGDPTGCGKTLVSLGLANVLFARKDNPEAEFNMLVICPASVKNNWIKEANKWLVPKFMAHKVMASGPWPIFKARRNIVIINYDIIERHINHLQEPWDLVIADESHYLKSSTSKRSKIVYENIKNAKSVMFCSATPLKNHPAELWPQLIYLDPATWTFPNGELKFWYFHKEYCGAYPKGYGWIPKGLQEDLSQEKLNELERVLRSTVMIRRNKEEVLPELPPKFRRPIEIEVDGAALKRIQEEQDVWLSALEHYKTLKNAVACAKLSGSDKEYRESIKNLNEGVFALSSQISTERRLTALCKVPFGLVYLKDLVAGGEDKIVLFGHHREVLEKFYKATKSESVLYYGGLSENQKQAALDRFNQDPNCHYCYASILSAGLGLNELVIAHHAVFAELTYVPTDITQAEDRLHRYGQEGENVLIDQLLFPNSIDAKISKILVTKQITLDNVLDSTFTKEKKMGGKSIFTELLEEELNGFQTKEEI